jgi:hypothetical protein
LGILAVVIDIVGSFAKMGRARHAGVAISHIETAGVASIPICILFYNFPVWLLLDVSVGLDWWKSKAARRRKATSGHR